MENFQKEKEKRKLPSHSQDIHVCVFALFVISRNKGWNFPIIKLTIYFWVKVVDY
jgi:hypothetical protein